MEFSGVLLIGLAAILVAGVVLFFMLRRRDDDEFGSAELAETEPAPPVSTPESLSAPSEAPTAPPAESVAAVTPVSTEPIQKGSAPLSEPVSAEPQPVTISEMSDESEIAPDPLAKVESSAIPNEALSPEFLEARDSLGEAVLEGHFSRLDVFQEYETATAESSGPMGPRSEYFHRVVNKALEARDAFESLLSDEDRARFIDDHSRYLDDVSVESDADRRREMHQEQLEFLRQLCPKPMEQCAQA